MLPNLLHPLHTPGANLRIVDGPYKGQTGVLETFDKDKGVYSVRLVSNGDIITIEPDFTETAKVVTTPEGW